MPAVEQPQAAEYRKGWRTALLAIMSGIVLVTATAVVISRRQVEPEANTLAFTLAPAVEPGEFAVSPDGRRLVFTAVGDEGRTQLWIRPFDKTAEQTLAGTEDAAHPFWSPDSRWVAFFADGKLKRIDVVNGVAQTLASAPNGQGGTWGPNGSIVFSNRSGMLRRISVNDGAIQEVFSPKRSELGAMHSPSFLPDGLHLLFTVSGSGEKRNGVYLASLNSAESRRLLVAGKAVYANDQLVFVRDGLLMTQAFRVNALELAGEPRLLGFADRVGDFSVSQNGVLAYRVDGDLAATIAFADRSGRTITALDNVSGADQFSWSPDGKRVAFSRKGDIWIGEFSRGVVERFTVDPADESFPIWGPDGNSIIFISNRGDAHAVYRKTINGEPESPMMKLPPGSTPSLEGWSPDGRFITYTTSGNSRSQAWMLSVSGDSAKAVLAVPSNFDIRHPRVSPDGRWLAYVSNESGRDEVFVQMFPEPGGKWLVSNHGGTNPKWSRDGRELFYVAPDRNLMSVRVELRNRTPEFGASVLLFPLFRTAYDVAPDGRFLLLQPMTAEPTSPIQVIINWTSGLN